MYRIVDERVLGPNPGYWVFADFGRCHGEILVQVVYSEFFNTSLKNLDVVELYQQLFNICTDDESKKKGGFDVYCMTDDDPTQSIRVMLVADNNNRWRLPTQVRYYRNEHQSGAKREQWERQYTF